MLAGRRMHFSPWCHIYRVKGPFEFALTYLVYPIEAGLCQPMHFSQPLYGSYSLAGKSLQFWKCADNEWNNFWARPANQVAGVNFSTLLWTCKTWGKLTWVRKRSPHCQVLSWPAIRVVESAKVEWFLCSSCHESTSSNRQKRPRLLCDFMIIKRLCWLGDWERKKRCQVLCDVWHLPFEGHHT